MMKKEVVCRWAGIGLVSVAVIGLAAAGINTAAKHRHERFAARADAAEVRLLSEWSALGQDRLLARWTRELVRAKRRAVDEKLYLDDRPSDSLSQATLANALRDAAVSERQIELAPKQCEAKIEQVRQKVYSDAQKREEAMKVAGVGSGAAQFARLGGNRLELSERYFEQPVYDQLSGGMFSNGDGCKEWYSEVYSDKGPSMDVRVRLRAYAELEAADGEVRRYTIHDAVRPEAWERAGDA